jgi:hypothetical protein
MEDDDGKRPQKGVVVTLLDMGDRTSRVIMGDVTLDTPSRNTSWTIRLVLYAQAALLGRS